MMFRILLNIFVISQIIFLLLSPTLKEFWLFSFYYQRIFVPFLKDDRKYKWKYHLVPIFYVTLYTYMVLLYFTKLNPIIKSQLTILERWVIIPFSLLISLLSGILTMRIRPESSLGFNSSPYQDFEFDSLIFYPNTFCSTCRLEKPARSKHCNICNRCVLLSDHHCIWANNCIGLGNYQYFYTFLVSNTLLLGYAFLRIILLTAYSDIGFPNIVLTFLILSGAFFAILLVFTYLQFALVYDGMTTNEKDKWFTIQEFMREGRLIRTDNGQWLIAHPEEPAGQATRFYSTNAYDHTIYCPVNFRPITHHDEIPNIYDKGSFLKNLKELCKY
ncbi:hypothetical protein KAFR_0B05370 [Kazachstania africana CBS 2517]|uniref:Palmitoyltransferase n=1 Tax=Kazachstania africana (strain ATCC 22294 / BCRC 22015 / CBS 2517 / CECT 1963 / NBRC 1671 / NRRL Y-8276) TaxID=1071382 RepID=H2AR32_KAZAF|nr:hypothetical protein KAFR_0B05370 [Kazachstania africana CBS 2517]CCF56832.1 hypothetical protein KAFR_0B05370 [Kazachstania africana CBS 2517]